MKNQIFKKKTMQYAVKNKIFKKETKYSILKDLGVNLAQLSGGNCWVVEKSKGRGTGTELQSAMQKQGKPQNISEL